MRTRGCRILPGMERYADFRSDTVTRPTEAMRQAMAAAEVGDDVLGDDPTVQRLEARAAEMLGKDAALYVPSGTMGNAIAVKVWTQEGDEVIVEERSHIYNLEVAHLSMISRVLPRPVPSQRGAMDPERVERAIRKRGLHIPGTSLICLENTHNYCGGAVVPLENFRAIREVADRHGLKVHLDGARIFNAQVASGVPAREFARYVDSVMFCFSKGLGAPIGSILVGPKDFIEEARRVRKLLGGGMRQVGVIAAAALVALETMIDRLADDHRRAKRLAQGLAEIPGIALDPETVETNIVFFDIVAPGWTAPAFVEAMKQHGVLCLAAGPQTIRMVTHKDVDDTDVERAIEAAQRVLRQSPPA